MTNLPKGSGGQPGGPLEARRGSQRRPAQSKMARPLRQIVRVAQGRIRGAGVCQDDEMKSGKFKITITGSDADNSIRLGDLIDQLNAVKAALTQVDLAVTGEKSPSLFYRINSISMNSPAVFEFEAVSIPARSKPIHGRRVVSKFTRDLKTVISGKKPKEADLDLMESYGALVRPMRGHLSQVHLQYDDVDMDIPRNLDMRIDQILGPDQMELGSVVGHLDAIDIHNKKNLFKVYPVVGPTSIKCVFRESMLGEAVAGLNRFVRISGELHLKKSEKFPHLIKVSKIDVLPERSDKATLSGLRGIASGALRGLSSEEYVEKVRSGDW